MSSQSWVKFFKDAGIPSDLSAKYAVMFSDHRIQKDMLADIDREILSDIGIKAVGDKMAIMKHAKFVADQAKRDASSKLLADGIKTLETRSASSPAQRMINHSINSRSPSGRNSPVVVADDTKSKVSDKKATEDASKSSVFDRLGNDAVNSSPGKASGVFSRLGNENNASKELPYAGVLKKSSPVTPKKKILVTRKAKSTSVLDRLGAEKTPVIPDSSTHVIAQTVTLKTVPKKVVAIKRKTVTKPITKQILIKRKLDTTVTASRKTSNVLDRLGDIVTVKPTLTTSKQAVTKSTGGKRKLLIVVPKKSPIISLKRKSTGDIDAIVAKKPISSNTVSSTSSAGIFKGGAKASSNVFSRLGAK